MVEFRFEYDHVKSRADKAKHGMDFEEAQGLWLDEYATSTPSRRLNEERYLFTGMLAGVLWTAVVTWRNGRIRIISVRRARREEARTYGR